MDASSVIMFRKICPPVIPVKGDPEGFFRFGLLCSRRMGPAFRVRPAAVHGDLMSSGMARVVSDGRFVVVVTAQARRFFRLVTAEPGVSVNKQRLTVESEGGVQGVLTVAAAGGCTCGKPWMNTPSDQVLLAEAASKFGVAADVG